MNFQSGIQHEACQKPRLYSLVLTTTGKNRFMDSFHFKSNAAAEGKTSTEAEALFAKAVPDSV